MRICIDQDIWLEDPLTEDDKEILKSLCVQHTDTEIKAQKVDLDQADMEDLLDLIEYYMESLISLRRYEWGRYTLDFYV